MNGNDRNRNRKINSKKLGIADKEHYLNKGGVGPQNRNQALYIIPSTYTGEILVC